MKIGMIGLGRMGANMVRRLLRAGHAAVAYDINQAAVDGLAEEGAEPAADLAALVAALERPRTLWIMVPAALVDATVDQLAPLLEAGDCVIDGGNSHYRDDLRRARTLAQQGIDYLDVGTSGGVWGLERGYCLMIGGAEAAARRLIPVFAALAPGGEGDPESSFSDGRQGFLYCGSAGGGHFVKMVHNGIEYALMAAYAEGFNLLDHGGVGRADHATDAETAPLAEPEAYQYEFDLPAVAEVWRHGSVIGSWLLDLTASALARSPNAEGFSSRVADSGEGRWTNLAAVETGTPVPVLAAALYSRFSSRGEDDLANRLLSAMRHAFGGH